MGRAIRCFLVLALGLAPPACSLVTPLDDLGPADADAGGSSDAPDLDVHADLEVVDGANGSCVCVDPPAAGFLGPVATWTGSGTAPACDTSYGATSFDGFFGPHGAPATCGCTCGQATSVSCPSSISAQLFGNGTCTGGGCDTVTLSTASCNYAVQANCLNVNGIRAAMTPSGGSCAPQPTTAVPAMSWDGTARLCETPKPPTHDGCTGGQLCAPVPASPYEVRPCIVGQGDLTCPAFYSYKRVFYTGSSDTRGCTACTCGTPTGTCTATLLSDCSSAVTLSSNTCASLGDPGGLKLQGQPTFSGSCAPQGGQPTGALTGTQATTVCCVP